MLGDKYKTKDAQQHCLTCLQSDAHQSVKFVEICCGISKSNDRCCLSIIVPNFRICILKLLYRSHCYLDWLSSIHRMLFMIETFFICRTEMSFLSLLDSLDKRKRSGQVVNNNLKKDWMLRKTCYSPTWWQEQAYTSRETANVKGRETSILGSSFTACPPFTRTTWNQRQATHSSSLWRQPKSCTKKILCSFTWYQCGSLCCYATAKNDLFLNPFAFFFFFFFFFFENIDQLKATNHQKMRVKFHNGSIVASSWTSQKQRPE